MRYSFLQCVFLFFGSSVGILLVPPMVWFGVFLLPVVILPVLVLTLTATFILALNIALQNSLKVIVVDLPQAQLQTKNVFNTESPLLVRFSSRQHSRAAKRTRVATH